MAERQAIRDNPELQQFVLHEARPTGRHLGVGSYGSVVELQVKGLVCAGKQIHEALLEPVNAGVINIERKYLEECRVMAKMRHPHVVQFLGLCYLEGSTLPVLVMERMDSSLDELLEGAPGLPLALKQSLLADTVRGLLYLHTRDPPIVHRDLTSKNILLTSSLVAKISDLGNARIVPDLLTRTLTCMPGAMVYMAPEAFHEGSRYGPPLDIFSYGHLALFTLTQVFPGSLLPSTFADPECPNQLLARSELERRRDYIQPLHWQFGDGHPLVQMVHQCLQDNPAQRPSAEDLLQQLDETRAQIKQPYGSYYFKVQSAMMIVTETKMREKDREIELLQQELHQLQLQDEVDAKDAELQQKDSQLEQQGTELRERATQISRQESELQTLKEDKGRLQQQAQEKDAEISRQQRELQTLRRDKLELEMLRQKRNAWREEVEKLSPLRDEVGHLHSHVSALEEEIKLPKTDNEGLRKQLQSVTEESDKNRTETYRKASPDYDNLRDRLTEIQQVHVQLESELIPLREERASILMENACLREGVQPEKYAKLKEDHGVLEDHYKQMQISLEEGKTLVLQLQEQLSEANSSESDKLQKIHERMERYRQERDGAKLQMDELQWQLQGATEELQRVRETSESNIVELQKQLTQYHQEASALTTKAQDHESRMRRYRDERNQAQATNQTLQEEVTMLTQTVQSLNEQLQSKNQVTSSLHSMDNSTTDYPSHTQHAQDHGSSRSPSCYYEITFPTREQQYSPDKHASGDDRFRDDMGSPTGKSTITQNGENPGHCQSISSSTSSLASTGGETKRSKSQRHPSTHLAEVRTKEGTKKIYIQNPLGSLNPKDKPCVIVKHGDKDFEMGTLMYFGTIYQKELAGVQLDIRMPRSSNTKAWPKFTDGTCESDGERHFECEMGYGVYVPFSRIYVAADFEPFTV